MYDFSNDGFKLTDYHQMDDGSSMFKVNNFATELILCLITGSAPHQPIPVASLADHVDRNHLNENCGFSEEYKV